MNKKNIVILGAGISGLATAYWLHKKGYNLTVLEANSESGGTMISEKKDDFLIDYGPNSGLETTPLIRELVNDIGLQNELIYANKEAKKRYILKNDTLLPLPTNPLAFITTSLFSIKAKLQLLAEPFIGKPKNALDENIASFVRRRLGQEFLDYAVNPFVSGVYAGDPEKLSVAAALPKLYALEEQYGSLIKGAIKGRKERAKNKETSKQRAQLFSFKNGMQSFPLALAKKLEANIFYNATVNSVVKKDNFYIVNYIEGNENKSLNANIIISTLPAYITSNVFESIDPTLSIHLRDIYYPKVMTLYLGFKKKDIARQLDGFGFLIPAKENKTFLGAIWNSVLFPNRAPDETASFTLFIGGARMPQVFEMEKIKLIDMVLKEFKEIMKISSDPIFITEKLWQHAIPQYNIGYHEYENYFQQFEKEHPGLFLSGNYRGGISIGDCIKNADNAIKKI